MPSFPNSVDNNSLRCGSKFVTGFVVEVARHASDPTDGHSAQLCAYSRRHNPERLQGLGPDLPSHAMGIDGVILAGRLFTH